MLNRATFSFDHELLALLPKDKRGPAVVYRFTGHPAVKDAIEALGIPHTELKYLLTDERAIDFDYQLQPGDEIEVFGPAAVLEDYEPLIPAPPQMAFVLDVHLGKLARLLRLLGFDCRYENDFTESRLIDFCEEEQRILLTRSAGLLKHKTVIWGGLLRSEQPEQQLREVLGRFQLTGQLTPFKRCTVCNGLLHAVSKAEIADQLLPQTDAHFTDFWQCGHCCCIYWAGSHHVRMDALVTELKG